MIRHGIDADPDRIDQAVAYLDGEAADTLQEFVTAYPEETSLRLDYQAIARADDDLGAFIYRRPKQAQETFFEALCGRDHLNYDVPDTTIRFYSLPDEHTYRVGRYRTDHLDRLIAVEGKVIDHEGVQPYAAVAAFECQACGTVTYLDQSFGKFRKPQKCSECENEGPFRFVQSTSTLFDFQEVVVIPSDTNLNEPPEEVVYLTEDLAGTVDKGQHITLVGIYQTSPIQKESVLNTFIEAIDLEMADYVEADQMSQRELDRRIVERVEEATDDSDWDVARDEIVQHFVDRGIRAEEIHERIDELIDDSVLMKSKGDRISVNSTSNLA